MKENEVIWMHMTCSELAMLLRVLWAPYRTWAECRMPETGRFLTVIGYPEGEEAPFADRGAVAALKELEGMDEAQFGLGSADRKLLRFVIDMTKGGIEAEASWRAKQAEARTPLETLPEEPPA